MSKPGKSSVRTVLRFAVPLLLLALANNPATADSCTTVKKCDAHCSVSYIEHWRRGTPGFEADMAICMKRCLSAKPLCPEPPTTGTDVRPSGPGDAMSPADTRHRSGSNSRDYRGG